MKRFTVPAVIMLSFMVALAINLYVLLVLPANHLISSLYLIPVLIACHRLAPRHVATATAVAVGLYLVSARIAERPLSVLVFSVVGLLVGGYLAIQFSAHRLEIARRVRESEEVQQRLQTFLAMVAHDLAGGVTNVIVGAELLMAHDSLPKSETQRVAASAIAGGTRQIQRLLDDLRAAAAIGAGSFDVRAAPMDLVAVARQVVDQQQVTTNQHRLELNAADRLEGVWDRERVSQLLTNLVSNAIKYSPGGGAVQVTILPNPDGPTISVRDHGIGISPRERDLLFQPFSRADHAPEVPGTGLGLWIVKAIVEAHNGRIWVESEVGSGSAFFVALPSAGGTAGRMRLQEFVAETRGQAGEQLGSSEPSMSTFGRPERSHRPAGRLTADHAIRHAG